MTSRCQNRCRKKVTRRNLPQLRSSNNARQQPAAPRAASTDRLKEKLIEDESIEGKDMKDPPDKNDDLFGLLDISELIPTHFAPAGPGPDAVSLNDDSIQQQGTSLLITQSQKMQLRALGLDDSEIRLLKPEEAHKILGLKP